MRYPSPPLRVQVLKKAESAAARAAEKPHKLSYIVAAALAVVCLFFILYTWHIRRTINDINALTAGYNVQVSEQVEENADLQAAIDTEDQEILRERALAYAREHQGKSASGDEVFIDRSLAE